MPDSDGLDDLVESLNEFNSTAAKAAEHVDSLQEELEEPVEGGEAVRDPEPAAGRREGPGAADALEVPEAIRAPELEPGELGGRMQGAITGLGAEEAAGHAAGAVEGRMMAVMPEAGQQQGLDAIAGVLGGIAVLGLPAKGAVTTTAIGSKI